MNPSQVEGYEKLIFVHNFQKLKATFEFPKIFEIRDRNRLGICCRFLKTMALENQKSTVELTTELTRWYFCMNHKKFSLLCFGHTNSGKSLLVDLLCLQFEEWQIGVFSCPPGTTVCQFYLDGLLNTFVYRCDEIIFKNLSIVQKMKNLLEGSRLLDTDVKCKSKQQILPAPTIINMNGSTVASVFKWCHEEADAFRSRCVFIKMNIPLKHRIDQGDIKFLANSGKEFIYILTKQYLEMSQDSACNVKDYTGDICI